MTEATTLPTTQGSRVLAEWNAARQQQRQRAARDARQRVVVRPARVGRSFAGAENSRLTATFKAVHVSLNQDLQQHGRQLVGRSRQLSRDNDYVKRFFGMCQNHIVGPSGFVLHVPCKRPDGSIDVLDKLVIEQAFARWCKRGVCEITGRLSFRLLCRLLTLHAGRDGECIVRRIRNRRANAFGYQLQVIDPILLDWTYNAELGGGYRVRMGVEVDPDWRPVAYHFMTDVETGMAQRRVRVPASEIWHWFIQEEPNQVRGVPWIHTAMRRLNDLGGYEQAAIIAARIGASKMGFYTQNVGADGSPINPKQLSDQQEGDDDGLDDDGLGDLIKEAEPGVFELLPEGVDFKAFNPDYPHQNFGAFVKATLRGLASGLDVDYNTLANDLENVNYSSIRHGMLETREAWTNLQNWFKESFLDPLYTEWLEMAFLSGELGSLPVSKFDKFDVGEWQGRRWSWVDPYKDTQAKLLEIDNGLASYSGYIREKGQDPETVWREIEADRKRLKDILPPVPKPPTATSAVDENTTAA
jgi:lambda family phage portal protein